MSADDEDPELASLERQVERGSFFTHTLISQFADRVNELEPMLYGLLEVLVQRGVVSAEEVLAAGVASRDALAAHNEHMNTGLGVRVDHEPATEPVPVDCASRLHICKAACCRLSFALTVEEIEGGVVRWDLGQPYFIRHEADGHCTHLDRAGGGCSIYDRRPGVCRQYSCATDDRIWKDFGAMILNQEWLDENARGDEGVVAVGAMMHRPEDILHQIRPRR